MQPNKPQEPTPVVAGRFAGTGGVAGPAWFSFLR